MKLTISRLTRGYDVKRKAKSKAEMICKVCGKRITWREVARICFGEPKAFIQEENDRLIGRHKPEPYCLDHISNALTKNNQ